MSTYFVLILSIMFFGCGGAGNDQGDDDSLDGASSRCVMKPCHGLDLQCLEQSELTACDSMYALGDGCRSYASCQKQEGKCTLILTPSFEPCKQCVQHCNTDNPSNPSAAFECEAKCLGR